jgi:peptide/nickel transport system substrate-binding protein
MDDQIKNNPDQTVAPNEPEATPAPGKPTTVAPTEQPPGQPVVTSTPPAQPKSSKKLLKILAVVIVLAAAGAGAYLLLNKVNAPEKTETVQNTKKSVPLLRVGVSQPFPSAFYPKSEASIFPNEANSQIFEGLTKYQNENQVVPNLAASWTNPDNTTWSFKLKPNVKFHDGNNLTAQAVKSSIEALAPTDFGQAYGSTIQSVTAKDASTVEIKTKAPDPLLPNELANLWIYDTTSGKQNDPANGTGPYTLKPGTSLTAGSLDLVAVNGYHGGQPMVKEIDFKLYDDDKAITQDVKQDKLDLADLSSLSAVNDVKQYGYSSYVDKNPQVFFIIPNTLKANSPLSKLAVRQAIYEALDPDAIMKADGRTGTPATQFVPQEIPGYNPDVQRLKVDPVKAKSDLAAAGYPKGFSLTFTYFSTHQAVGAEVQKELAAIGITLNLDPETDGPTLQKKALGGQTDLFYFAYSSSLIDSSDVIQPLLVDSANYKNPDLDKLYQQASTTLRSPDRLKLLEQANKLAMDDVAGFPIFVPDGIYFAAKSNLVMHTDNLTNYIGVDFWKVYAQ